METNVYIALGTNLGDRIHNLRHAIQNLQSQKFTVLKTSRVYETTPMYKTDQPHFLNMTIQTTTCLSSQDTLWALKSIEVNIGRTKTYTNGPRIIDLDILYYGDTIIDTSDLYIPHLRICERQFVLQPMLDIAPNHMDVRTKKTIYEMANAIDKDPNMAVFADTL